MALTTSCPTCGNPKNPNARQCRPCANQSTRQTLTGRKHSAERRANISAGKRRQIASDGKVFDLAGYMAGRPHPFAFQLGTERVVKDGRVEVKTVNGWRYRSRLIWAEHHGPIPHGRVIHHINEDPMDDRLENLAMLTRAEHARVHADPERMREMQRKSTEARWTT